MFFAHRSAMANRVNFSMSIPYEWLAKAGDVVPPRSSSIPIHFASMSYPLSYYFFPLNRMLPMSRVFLSGSLLNCNLFFLSALPVAGKNYHKL